MSGSLDTLAGNFSQTVLRAKGFVKYFIKNVLYFAASVG